MFSTKEEIYSYLEKISREISLSDLKRFTANDISEALNISRNLASQYLNELVKEKVAVKVNSRPVYFFHRRSVERFWQITLDRCIFSGLDEFRQTCTNSESKRDFQKAVGHYLSLSSCIEQCKAAVHYPPNGLPVLLYGANGTGKSFLSRLMFEYGKNVAVIEKDRNYIAVDCAEYEQDLDKFTRNLYGEGDEKGWLYKTDGGILFFDEIDRLSPAGQELILSYLISGQYRMLHGKDKMYSSGARLVFATSKPPTEALIKALARRIPIMIPVPSLNERTMDEKEEMLVTFLKKEGRHMGADICISQNAFNCMLEYPFENNIDQLKSCITGSCARAYLEKNQDTVAIRTYHLPDYMMSGLKLEVNDQEDRLIRMESYSKDTSFEQAVQYFYMILETYQDYQNGTASFEELIKKCHKYASDYYDYLIYGRKMMNMKISTYEQLIDQIFENTGEIYGLRLSRKYSYLLSRCLYIQLREDHIISRWQKDNKDKIESLLSMIRQKMEKEAIVEKRIEDKIRQNLDLSADSLNQLLLLLNIISQNQQIQFTSMAGIILSHGYATASSIADAANQIVGKKVFEAIDMPLDMQMQDIVTLLENHIERYITCRNIVLLVDMGSLEQIHQEMKSLVNMNIGIINNISTALAVDIGFGICNGMDMEELLNEASKNSVCTYRIINNVQKEDAIIFSGENGIDIAEKIKEMILKISDASISVHFIACDYHQLVKNGSKDEIFSQYRVKCIIGLFNPEIEGVPFIPLEDIISMNASNQMNRIFSEYLDANQLEVFNQNLLKNFTLNNVVKSITILNPDKLLDEVEESVRRLQRITGQKIEGKLMIGLYVHLCCLVERLVTKNAIENYQNLEYFEENHQDFITEVKECFQGITGHYRVELPVSEIAYIYDYINMNIKSKAAVSSVDKEDE